MNFLSGSARAIVRTCGVVLVGLALAIFVVHGVSAHAAGSNDVPSRRLGPNDAFDLFDEATDEWTLDQLNAPYDTPSFYDELADGPEFHRIPHNTGYFSNWVPMREADSEAEPEHSHSHQIRDKPHQYFDAIPETPPWLAKA